MADLKNLARDSALEAIGTAMLVYFGCGAAVATGEALTEAELDGDHVGRIVPIALSFGLTVAVVVAWLAPLSGGHINPAVTLSLVAVTACHPLRGVSYFFAQLIGAIIGAGFLWGSVSGFSSDPTSNAGSPPYQLGANGMNPELYGGNGFMAEFMGTFLLCMTVLFTAVSGDSPVNVAGTSSIAPLTIGLAVLIAHLFLIPITSAGINPARSFGPNVFNGATGFTSTYWIFWIGPICGALAAAGVYKLTEMTTPAPETPHTEEQAAQESAGAAAEAEGQVNKA